MTAPAQSSGAAPHARRLSPRQRGVALAIVAAVALIFIGANAHLIAVSFGSDPECVPHLKSPLEGAATYRAAKSSC